VIDPRASIISRRTEQIGSIIAFASGKGGVGKSACAAVAALQLAREGRRVGLFDMDFTGASAHIFLGAELSFPEEERGIVPIEAGYGLRFMSAAAYSGETGFPLRGGEVTDVFLELFAITRWSELDYLILDMPPGMGDAVLDLIRYLPAAGAVIITTPSRVARQVVSRMGDLFSDAGVSVYGRIENMSAATEGGEAQGSGQQERDVQGSEQEEGRRRAGKSALEVPLLGSIPWSGELEAAVGNPEALLATDFAGAMRPAVINLESAVRDGR
jgi:ATP-binding protein involved in chromosome partitioning